ncbi:50S ribosomal protein L15 [Candidatus Curtissbacteria bacterium RIFCSPHIGHO2_01_FULL_41_44]|uniref:Large ribosomal subunit protein uL15 n=1 Tax=Candidatus Curtissbacteria bacterium RIFCSPLOWO2_01_FULL_42_50 TaxID=1797730 RepID=A0A1F5H2L6_9BACT|nr:MAG: 50S ribosomal protein L15 [Candidatus Curtissbacteria bacterium RIFCSPHIGHO2_02_FULL_42_58]OGD94757.1 MAG: 50S ribosomal protein L15 [Candidatus Curtissbacteria bacterium RIFCSPHIGHO2_01_FULL_41_44]OGD96300.1 MAG: 50S ribosomal protein L15 [Candidatus Curtissbacteria bacterium RIFCSPHIGHO2_12_FULL_42_33]OGD98319.1 MAG: 50S ribosomal protein L15 [Candidatus Curtissbacteria bacterium RIFCSPLOWO2_01_FULL_42_50]OGE02956.1 MAG: 50S ribosomal protein L15 [Candidatus Curtissbacteria bacterium 
MNLNTLPKITQKRAKRIGRGQSSGKGKTGGRGTKGQKARGKMKITHPHFEGGTRPLIKRLPLRRGIGNPKISQKPLVVNLGALNLLPENCQNVDLEALVKFGIVEKNDAKNYGVKILGDGNLSRALVINLPTSKSAAEKIQKAGGKVTILNQKSPASQSEAERANIRNQNSKIGTALGKPILSTRRKEVLRGKNRIPAKQG